MSHKIVFIIFDKKENTMIIKCENLHYELKFFMKRFHGERTPGVKVRGKNSATLYKIKEDWISVEDEELIPEDHMLKFIDVIEKIYIFDKQKN